MQLPVPVGPAVKLLPDRRIAWLVATNRIYHPDETLSRQSDFVARLRADGQAADRPRISRWESGTARIPSGVIRGYERLLGVPAYTLVAIAQGLRATFGSPHGQPAPIEAPAAIHGEPDRLFDLVAARTATGADWFELATNLTAYDRVYLHSRSWSEVATTLVSELCRSDHASYVRRYEALRILIRHPAARQHTVKAIGAFVMHPAAHVVAQPLTLLQEVTDDHATKLLLRLLDVGDGALSRGAAWVTAAKMARGQFAGGNLDRLERVTVRLLAEPTATSMYDAVDLACQLPEESYRRVREPLGDAQRRLVDRARESAEVIPRDLARRIARALAAEVHGRLEPTYPQEPDAMLEALIRESLFHVHKERRHHASTLLAASPYRHPLARLCLEHAGEHGEVVAARMLTLILYLGSGDARPALVGHALSDRSTGVQARALLALGFVEDPPAREDLDQVLGLARTAPAASVRYASMFALGMHGALQLTDFATSQSPWERAVAQWWLDVGAAVRDPDA